MFAPRQTPRQTRSRPLADIRPVTARFAVASQLRPEDVPALAGRFTLIVNNRPDGEEAAQPSGAEIERAAAEAGLGYVAVPIRGLPRPDQIAAVSAAVAAAEGPVLAFCRTGTRCIVAWAAGEALAGRPADELCELGAQAGYDLGPPLQAILGAA
jgi:uncharacterized protein (TIGR01244 family)